MSNNNQKTATPNIETVYEHYVKQSDQSSTNEFPQLVEVPARKLTKAICEKIVQSKSYKSCGIYAVV